MKFITKAKLGAVVNCSEFLCILSFYFLWYYVIYKLDWNKLSE